MKTQTLFCLLLVLSFVSLIFAKAWITYDQLQGKPYKVGYDKRAITINGERVMLLAGVVHYVRSTPAMWGGKL
jgi:hypothetical protein